jgi:hypothetical protein
VLVKVMILVLFDVVSVGMASIGRADCSVRIAMRHGSVVLPLRACSRTSGPAGLLT